MLEKIKGDFFKQLFFSFLKERFKLSIIKYNKKLQDFLKITLYNYKNVSGKYIIYEGKGKEKGKEFKGSNDKLLFEGEYKNGRRNGIGIEYDEFKGLKLYEGEFKNGKRNGNGKEYKYNGKISFEGEYKNGKKWTGYGNKYDFKNNFYEIKDGKGYVKESDFYGNLFYKGEYLNGKRHGKGAEYYEDEIIFEGEYLYGKRWNGISYGYRNKNMEKLKNGKGANICNLYLHNGEIIEYIGEYFNGEKNGIGREEDEYGFKFEGEYLDGQIKLGKIFYVDELIFSGEFVNNDKKKGKEYIKNKLEFEGEYLWNNKYNGMGYDEYGNKIYELNNGNGKIKKYFQNGNLEYEGGYLNLKKNGEGKEYFLNGEKNL